MEGVTRELSWVFSLLIMIALVHGCWYVQSEGIFEQVTGGVGNTVSSISPGNDGPTPTAPAIWDEPDSSSSDQIWGDKWVEFSKEPQVCQGSLELRGQAKNGAAVSSRITSTVPFVLYRRSDLAPRPGYSFGTVDPIAAFLRPLTGGRFYPNLRRDDIVADALEVPPSGGFRLVANWPKWLPEPERVALGVWGFRPGQGQDNIRLIEVAECDSG